MRRFGYFEMWYQKTCSNIIIFFGSFCKGLHMLFISSVLSFSTYFLSIINHLLLSVINHIQTAQKGSYLEQMGNFDHVLNLAQKGSNLEQTSRAFVIKSVMK